MYMNKKIIKNIVWAVVLIGLCVAGYFGVKDQLRLRKEVRDLQFANVQLRDFVAYTFPDQVAAYNAKIKELEAAKQK